MKLNILPIENFKIVKATIAEYTVSNEPKLVYICNEGICIYIAVDLAIVLDHAFSKVKGKANVPFEKGIAMTMREVIFVSYLIQLRKQMLEKMNLRSLDWELCQYYYIKLANGKKFSLPSLLSKYTFTCCRDSITLSSGLWKYMWYCKISFNLPKGKLEIIDTGKAVDMSKCLFKYDGTVYSKGQTIVLN